MPLDTTTLNLEALEASSGFIAAYRYSKTGLQPVSDDAEADDVQAGTAFALWKTASGLTGAGMMLMRQGGALSIVSKQGGLIITARNTCNVGMVRQLVKALPAVDSMDAVELPELARDGVQSAVWAIAQRLGRIEVPRTFEMMVGQYEYVLKADRNGFAIVDEAGGIERFVGKVRDAVEGDFDIEYTLGASSAGEESSHHTVAEIFGTSSNNSWGYDKAGWPVAIPASAELSNIEFGARIACVLAPAIEDETAIDLLDAGGRVVLSGRSTGDGFTFSRLPKTF